MRGRLPRASDGSAPTLPPHGMWTGTGSPRKPKLGRHRQQPVAGPTGHWGGAASRLVLPMLALAAAAGGSPAAAQGQQLLGADGNATQQTEATHRPRTGADVDLELCNVSGHPEGAPKEMEANGKTYEPGFY